MRELSELSIVLKNTRVIRGNDLYNTWDEDENGVGLWTHAIMVDKETHYRMELFEPYWSDSLDGQIDTFAHELYHGTEDNIKKIKWKMIKEMKSIILKDLTKLMLKRKRKNLQNDMRL